MKNEKVLLSLPFAERPKIVCSDKKAKVYKAEIVTVSDDEYMSLTIYDADGAEYRVFIKGDDYIAQRRCKEEYQRSTAKISYFMCQYSYLIRYISTDDTEECISAWAKKNSIASVQNGIYTVSHYLDKVGERKAEAKFRRIQEAVDRVMLAVKPLPSDFNTWLENVVFKDSRYIVYEYSGKRVQQGYCTHCKRHIEVQGARNKQPGICPKCHSHITYYASGKLNIHDMRKMRNVAYIQPNGNDFIIRRFEVTRVWQYDALSKELIQSDYVFEHQRIFYNAKRYFNVPEGKGYFREYGGGYGPYKEYVYAKKLKKIAENSRYPHMKYIPWTSLLNTGRYNFQNVWKLCADYPIVESYIKRKMYNYVQELSNESREGTEDLLNIPKSTLKVIERYDMRLSEMPLYMAAKVKNIEYFPEILKMYREYRSGIDVWRKILKYNTLPKLQEYFKAQGIDWEYRWYSRMTMSDYADYLEQCEKLEWDMTDTKIIRPNDFKARHDYATEQVELKEEQIDARGVMNTYYKYIYGLYYTDGEYTVTMPRNVSDLKYEGDELHHCVYTNYTQKVAEGKTIICTIRKNDELYKPLATAELSPENYSCIQIRAIRNNVPNKEVMAFWDKYMKKIKKLQSLQEVS